MLIYYRYIVAEIHNLGQYTILLLVLLIKNRGRY